MQCVAKQYDVVEIPICVPDQQEVYPFRVVREQLMPAQILCECVFQIGACLLVRQPGKAGFGPGLWIAFNDEGAGRCTKFVRVRCKYTGGRFTKRECQAVKQLMRAVPDVFVWACAEIRFELISKGLPDGAVYAVGAHE